MTNVNENGDEIVPLKTPLNARIMKPLITQIASHIVASMDLEWIELRKIELTITYDPHLRLLNYNVAGFQRRIIDDREQPT